MTNMDKSEMKSTVEALLSAPSCCPELKAVAQAWLAAVGTSQEATVTAALLQEAREDLCTIEHTLGFFESPAAEKIFGAEKAKAMATHAREIQSQGAKWCDCPACAACVKLLEL